MDNFYIKSGFMVVLISLLLSLSHGSFSLYSYLRAELKAASSREAVSSANSQQNFAKVGYGFLAAPSDFVTAKRSMKLQRLARNNTELEKTLEFMVWPKEQLKLQKQLLDNLEQKLNLAPLESQDWLALLSIQLQTRAPIQDQHWALKQGMGLNNWHADSRPVLAHYCINSQLRVEGDLRTECLELFRNLPWRNNRSTLAKLVGVSSETLDAVLREADNTLQQTKLESTSQ